MEICKIKLAKSRTFGVTINQKTRYHKINIELEAKLSSSDEPLAAEQSLSLLMEDMLAKEQEILIK